MADRKRHRKKEQAVVDKMPESTQNTSQLSDSFSDIDGSSKTSGKKPAQKPKKPDQRKVVKLSQVNKPKPNRPQLAVRQPSPVARKSVKKAPNEQDELSSDTDESAADPAQRSSNGNVNSPKLKPHRANSQVMLKQPEGRKDKCSPLSERMPFIQNPHAQKFVILVRNSEEMSAVFKDWTSLCFKSGAYEPSDMNQPATLPKRLEPERNYRIDPPLTVLGVKLAELFGRTLVHRGVIISHIYSSPALRCVQTAQEMLRAQCSDVKIRVEPALFDNNANESVRKGKKTPAFMTYHELKSAGLNVDTEYRPIHGMKSLEDGWRDESPADFFERSSLLVEDLLRKRPSTGTILVVTHACSLHAIARGLLKRHAVVPKQLGQLSEHYPFCSGMAFAQRPDRTWKLQPNVVPTICFGQFNNRFDAQFLLE